MIFQHHSYKNIHYCLVFSLFFFSRFAPSTKIISTWFTTMKFARTAFAAALFSASAVAFQQPHPLFGARSLKNNNSKSSALQRFSTATSEPSAPCATPDIIPESVTAKQLRSAYLTNANGEIVNLGEKMGKGTSIVIFLRHLG
jgi:hypothetical protein